MALDRRWLLHDGAAALGAVAPSGTASPARPTPHPANPRPGTLNRILLERAVTTTALRLTAVRTSGGAVGVTARQSWRTEDPRLSLTFETPPHGLVPVEPGRAVRVTTTITAAATTVVSPRPLVPDHWKALPRHPVRPTTCRSPCDCRSGPGARRRSHSSPASSPEHEPTDATTTALSPHGTREPLRAQRSLRQTRSGSPVFGRRERGARRKRRRPRPSSAVCRPSHSGSNGKAPLDSAHRRGRVFRRRTRPTSLGDGPGVRPRRSVPRGWPGPRAGRTRARRPRPSSTA